MPPESDATAAEQPVLPVSASEPPTVWNIQGLRGIAALMVVWAHAKFVLTDLVPDYQPPAILATSYGAAGVDLFFIISGYVISMTAGRKHQGARDFLCARIARVTPLYLLLTLPCLIAQLVASRQGASFASAWNGFFYLPLFDFHGYKLPPLEIGWSLSFEMWFYLVFALLLLFLSPARVAIGLPVLFCLGAILTTPYDGAWFFPRFMFHPFVIEFSLGCVVFATQRWVTGWRPFVFLTGGLVYLVLFSPYTGRLSMHQQMFIGSAGVHLAWERVLLWGLPLAFITTGLVGLERSHRLVFPRFLLTVGGFSYSLYLWHWLLLKGLFRFGQRLGIHEPLLALPVVLALDLLLAWLSWQLLEIPLTRWAQRLLKTHSRPPGLSPAAPPPRA